MVRETAKALGATILEGHVDIVTDGHAQVQLYRNAGMTAAGRRCPLRLDRGTHREGDAPYDAAPRGVHERAPETSRSRRKVTA